MRYQLGLDTGGTYTDAVLVDRNKQVLACGKSLTTHADLLTGLRGALNQVVTLDNAGQIELVSVSTTLATNALVEGRGRSVALVLIGFTAVQMQRAGLAQALAGDPHLFLPGGHDANGQVNAPLERNVLREFLQRVDHRVDAYAVSAMFATRNPAHENQARALITQHTGKPVSCGHHFSSALDAPRRALTALLNARLIPMIGSLLGAIRILLAECGIKAPIMVVKGDGSLISLAVALDYPVETILSGPAASVVGAQFLCTERELVVSDMGGTTTDVALIREGQPRLSPDGATVGGWRTMVRAVDVHTFGLGGDSAVRFDRQSRRYLLGQQRVLPLSLLTQQYPVMLDVLHAQLELPICTTHCAQFVMVHDATRASVSELSRQQCELYERILQGPIALQTLFCDQTLERALARLEQRGLVLRAGFTPSDACHVLGTQHDWQTQGAILGAQLLMRYAQENLGPAFSDEQEFARSICGQVVVESAMVLLESVAASTGTAPRVGASTGASGALSDSQRALLRVSLSGREPERLVSLQPRLHVPIVGLGAPAHSFYPQAASLLGTKLIETRFAHVANALGAVVGTIRQEQQITITPAGGNRVRVMFPGGPVEFDSLEAGAEAACRECEKLAKEKAVDAGGAELSVEFERHDTIVKDGDQSVFFESRIIATAVGRPSTILQ